ncbi:calcium-binding protein [Nereida sp. MMG025]|uniref:calcium-binding protein n=1 Tax=Nereida sp. MMG025 TaxID=2909981 RepID=UPI001F18F0F6|nr:hypothetical protein [Nereida sp. MMG025]MCF6445415.1 hypothetical protein [Nereida sp. MMG025]
MSLFLLPLLVSLGLVGLVNVFDDDETTRADEEENLPPEPTPPSEPPAEPEPTAKPTRIIGDDEPNTVIDLESTQDLYINTQGGDDRVDLDGPSNDTIFAGDGNDEVSPGDGDDQVFLGQGDDYFGDVGGRNDPDYGGDDLVRGGGGADSLYSISGADTLYGGTGGDLLSALDILPQFDGVEARPDQLFGGKGADQLFFDDGDTVSGGDGIDSFSLSVESPNATAVTITDYNPKNEMLELRFAGENPILGPGFGSDPDFNDLLFEQSADDTHISLNGQLLAIVQDTDVDDVQFSNIQVVR